MHQLVLKECRSSTDVYEPFDQHSCHFDQQLLRLLVLKGNDLEHVVRSWIHRLHVTKPLKREFVNMVFYLTV